MDIGKSGDLAWDEMFVFGPYYPKDEICKTLNLSVSQCSAAGIKDVDEGEFLLVFIAAWCGVRDPELSANNRRF